MNNSLIYVITTTSSEILTNGILPLTTIARRRCKCIQTNGDSIILNAPGYYKIDATITLTGSAAGDAEIQLQKNSVPVPGIVGSTTITTPDTELAQITLSGVVRVGCSESAASLTLVSTGIGITTTNISIDVEYLD